MDSHLLTPFRFANGIESPNRLWLAPLTNTQSHVDGTLSNEELAWLSARAAGGFGVVESCATHVTEDGQGWDGQWGIFDDALGQLDRGAAGVALGRAAITTPDWPRRVARDGGEPLRPPVTAAQLRDRALGERFIDYMRRFSGFLADA